MNIKGILMGERAEYTLTLTYRNGKVAKFEKINFTELIHILNDKSKSSDVLSANWVILGE